VLGTERHRPFWMRAGSVFVRAAHLVAVAAVGGVALLGLESRTPHAWWIVAGLSGLLLLAAEVFHHPELHRELAGWCTVLKLVLVGLVFLLPAAAPWWMGAAVVVAALGAHSPKRWRHRRML
jgi:hypothetical protein